MTERPSYKQTRMDRLGPDAANILRSAGWGLVIGAVFFPIISAAASQILHLSRGPTLGVAFVGSVVIGGLVIWVPLIAANMGEKAFHAVMTRGGTSPYTEQNSYQQALVMQGGLDEALASLEAIIAEPGSTLDVRIRAAELYAREAKNAVRAAELFREVIRDPRCAVGEEVYSANRLVDLLTGPLGQPGRALVELGRLADRYPTSIIGENARQALRSLKALAAERDQPPI